MKTYERTHPWIRFEIDLRAASAEFWMLLGEACSKCEHISSVPLQPRTAAYLHQLYLAKGALATTAIEGNTLSEDEVIKHLEGKLRLPPSKQYLAREIDNIVAACNRLRDELQSGSELKLEPGLIKRFNAEVLDNLKVDDGVVPGAVRSHSVGVARYRGAPAEDCDYLLDRLCSWLSGPGMSPPDVAAEMRMAHAIIRALLAHLYLAWIHPFGDGNGRTARLVEFFILVTSGFPTPAAHLLSNHYNQTRSEYYRQLDQASQSRGEPLPFINYALRGFVDGLRSQLEVIRDQQWHVAWENYVHDRFRGRNSESEVRKRHLVLDLSEIDDPIPLAKLREVSARVAAAYAKKTLKTLSRDVISLMDMGLIEQTADGYRANKEAILAFLPLRRDP